MITIEAYRAAVGTFLEKARNVKCNLKKKKFDSYCQGENQEGLFLQKFVCFIVIVILYLNFHYATFSLLKLLIDMDVESNPGPTYDILSSVQGSFNQGNILKFGLGAGTQCACNSLYAICWSIIKKVSRWQTNDLDHILTEGDRVYKCITTENYALLCADDLPDVIQQGDGIFIINKLRLETGEATLVNNFPFLSSLFNSCNNKGDGFLFFIRNVTLAIIPIYDTHSRYYYYYLFDSHSRDERGLVVEDGQSVLLKFRDLLQVEKYIQVVYLEFRDSQSEFFQMQFVKVTVSNIDKLKEIVT